VPNFGAHNPALTKAINAVACESSRVRFSTHSEDQMEKRNFDHAEVLACLTKGTAYGPEPLGNDTRANVVHRGLQIRVVVGGLGHDQAAWPTLESITVVTVMEAR